MLLKIVFTIESWQQSIEELESFFKLNDSKQIPDFQTGT